MPPKRFEVPVGSQTLVGERWDGSGAPVVLLHAGVADRRVWREVGEALPGPVVAYDRRGFGDTPPPAGDFTHVDDLCAVLDATVAAAAWLVGNSMGGALAIDAALSVPERVAGLILIAPAVSGEPEPATLDPDTQRIIEGLGAAGEAGDVGELLRLHAWLWLDGPASPEGRVTGAARELALAMNEIIVRNDVPDEAGASSADAWPRLEEIAVSTTVMWGDRDVPAISESCRVIAGRVPGARTRVLAGAAHLPSLEQPDALAREIRSTIGAA
jgi:pimeloyl-ACP methyl ester carboxylesterase